MQQRPPICPLHMQPCPTLVKTQATRAPSNSSDDLKANICLSPRQQKPDNTPPALLAWLSLGPKDLLDNMPPKLYIIGLSKISKPDTTYILKFFIQGARGERRIFLSAVFAFWL